MKRATQLPRPPKSLIFLMIMLKPSTALTSGKRELIRSTTALGTRRKPLLELAHTWRNLIGLLRTQVTIITIIV